MKLSIFSFLLIAIFTFSSCEKGNDFNKSDKAALKDGDKDDYKKGCFELVYPVTYTMPDGSTETVNNEKDWDNIKAWYEAHPDSAEKPTIEYPVEVTWEDGTTKTINNEDEMILAKKGCDDKDWDKELCFEFVYPLTYIMPDDSEISGDAEETLWTAIKDWYEAHPDSQEKPALQYPVEIVFKEDATQTINNEDEMIAAKKDCFDKDEDDDGDDG